MKYNLIALVIAFFCLNGMAQNCHSTSSYFKIDSAYKLTEHAGVYGGGTTIHYTIFITVKKNKLQDFDSAWAYNDKSKITTKIAKNISKKDKYFKKNDHLQLQFSVNYYHDSEPALSHTISTKKPINCKQELIFRYTAKKNIQYIVWSEFKKISILNLP